MTDLESTVLQIAAEHKTTSEIASHRWFLQAIERAGKRRGKIIDRAAAAIRRLENDGLIKSQALEDRDRPGRDRVYWRTTDAGMIALDEFEREAAAK
jgi:hypothetical protein